jgi:microcystin-dependent protein
MADPFVAEIRIFPFNFPPKGWAFCNGQLMPISQNTALFSLLGTYYGGDGKSTFALPDLQGNAAMHPGQGQGLSLRDLGEQGGTQTVTLLLTEIPAHNHSANYANEDANLNTPQPTRCFAKSSNGFGYYASPPGPAPTLTQMNFQEIGISGLSQSHNNMQPFLTLNFCIALQGVFPPRS